VAIYVFKGPDPKLKLTNIFMTGSVFPERLLDQNLLCSLLRALLKILIFTFSFSALI